MEVDPKLISELLAKHGNHITMRNYFGLVVFRALKLKATKERIATGPDSCR